MEFEYSKKTKMYQEQLVDFMNKFVYPNESTFRDQLDSQADRWTVPPIMEELKAKARERGLWNLFLPESERGAGLTNLEYAPLCEIMGRSPIAPEAFNCAAPDTGNMELLAEFGSPDQQAEWLIPLLEGRIRSAFCMTEPDVASSDATNIATAITPDGDGYVINGRKWLITGADGAAFTIVMARAEGEPSGATMFLADMNSPGIRIERILDTLDQGFAGGHAVIAFEDLRVPSWQVLGAVGEGLRYAQVRLAPARLKSRGIARHRKSLAIFGSTRCPPVPGPA